MVLLKDSFSRRYLRNAVSDSLVEIQYWLTLRGVKLIFFAFEYLRLQGISGPDVDFSKYFRIFWKIGQHEPLEEPKEYENVSLLRIIKCRNPRVHLLRALTLGAPRVHRSLNYS